MTRSRNNKNQPARKPKATRSVKPKSHKVVNDLESDFPSTSKALKLLIKIQPRSESQKEYLELIEDSDITFGLGPSGTGKTFLAVAKAVEDLIDGYVKKIILVRPIVEAGESLGFLPGTFQDKIDPYLIPLYDALNEMLGPAKVKSLIEDKTIELAALAFMRGRTLKDAFILMDEAQNTTYEQMKMFLTRFGAGSKAVVTGDTTQVDLPYGNKSGLPAFVNMLEDVQGIGIYLFNNSDIVRHPLVNRIVKACDNFESNKK